MKLFASCPVRSSESSGHIRRIGTFISIQQQCSNKECLFARTWHSQPMCGKVPAGNIQLSSSILFSGAIPAHILWFLNVFGCQAICKSTFFEHQHNYLSPAVKEVWSKEQQNLLSDVKKTDAPLVVGGDGRSDMPGHSVKYGTYLLLDLDNKIIAMELVKISLITFSAINLEIQLSTEVKSSVHMEKEGLIRCVHKLEECEVIIGKIITDRHVQITKWLSENLEGILHFFDAWHLARNLKKILKISKIKGCELAAEWCKAIINHLYYVASNTQEGKSDLIIAKWLSLDNHLHNIHRGHGKLFPKWLTANEGFHRDDKKSSLTQDWRKILEKSHVANKHQDLSHSTTFCSKTNSFFFPEGMESRLYMAALHSNENGKKEQADTKDGYAQRLLLEAHHRCRKNIKNPDRPKYEFLCSKYEHPERSAAVEGYLS